MSFPVPICSSSFLCLVSILTTISSLAKLQSRVKWDRGCGVLASGDGGCRVSLEGDQRFRRWHWTGLGVRSRSEPGGFLGKQFPVKVASAHTLQCVQQQGGSCDWGEGAWRRVVASNTSSKREPAQGGLVRIKKILAFTLEAMRVLSRGVMWCELYFGTITLVAGFRVSCREARVKAPGLLRKLWQ